MNKHDFIKALMVFAKATNYELHELIIEMYVDSIRPYGFESAIAALKEVFKGNSRRMPSIDEIVAMLKPSTDHKKYAAELADKMISSVGRKGFYWSGQGGYAPFGSWEESCMDYFKPDGQVALDIIKQHGGWTTFHSQYNNFDGNEKARLRVSIESKLAVKKSNDLKIGIESSDRKLLNERN